MKDIRKIISEINSVVEKRAFVPPPQYTQEQEQAQQQQQAQQEQAQAAQQQQAASQQQGQAKSIDDTIVALPARELLDLVSGGKASMAQIKIQELMNSSQRKEQMAQQADQVKQQDQQAKQQQKQQEQAFQQGGVYQ